MIETPKRAAWFVWFGIGVAYRVGNFRPWPAEACRG